MRPFDRWRDEDADATSGCRCETRFVAPADGGSGVEGRTDFVVEADDCPGGGDLANEADCRARVGVAVPPGGGVGDGEADERSPGWPRPACLGAPVTCPDRTG